MLVPNRNASSTAYRYGFQGQEKDDEIKGEGNSVDFGNRMHDPRVGRFLSIDKYANKFAYQSPYVFAGNTPIRGRDIKGDSLYIVTYVNGKGYRGNDMFRAAALTRAKDIKNNGTFDPAFDKVVILKVDDVWAIKEKVEYVVDKYNYQYGETAEFSIYSHSSLDGPVGSAPTSKHALDGFQMSIDGWKDINFNFAENNAKARIMGCRSGVCSTNSDGEVTKNSFVTRLSILDNFHNVTTVGQIDFSYPSTVTDVRTPTIQQVNDSFIYKGKDGNTYFETTYLVGGKGRSKDWDLNEQNVAYPVRESKNGKTNINGFQEGAKSPDFNKGG